LPLLCFLLFNHVLTLVVNQVQCGGEA